MNWWIKVRTNYTSSSSWDKNMIHNCIWSWVFLSKLPKGFPESELHFSKNEIECMAGQPVHKGTHSQNYMCYIFINQLKFTMEGTVLKLRGEGIKGLHYFRKAKRQWENQLCPSSITSPTCPKIKSSSSEDRGNDKYVLMMLCLVN